MERQTGHDACSGFSFLELSVSLSVMVIGLLSLAGALTSGARLADYNRETHAASNEARMVMEDFRARAATDFETVVKDFLPSDSGETYTASQLTGRGGSPATLHATVILDETAIVPPVDLNDDGDYTDRNLTPADVKAIYLQTVANWQAASGPRSMSFGILMSRAEITGSSSQVTPREDAGTDADKTIPEEAEEEDVECDRVSAKLIGSFTVRGSLWFVTENVGEDLNVDAITVQAGEGVFIEQIRFDGSKVLRARRGEMPSSGTKVALDPFEFELGHAVWTRIDFAGSADGAPVNLDGMSFKVIYHLETGEVVSVAVPGS